MDKQVFRDKSIERISSPEELQDYMRVTNPGIWMVLAAVIALLLGLLVSSALSTLESSVQAKGELYEDGSIVMQLPIGQKDAVQPGKAVRVAGHEAHVDFVYQYEDALGVMASLDEQDAQLPEGTYEVEIVTESLSPISFLLN